MKFIEVPFANGTREAQSIKSSGGQILDFLKLKNLQEEKIFFKENVNTSKINLINDLEKDFETMYKIAFNSFGERTFFLGGDHSISYPLSRAFFDYSEYNGKVPCVIIFDSDPNCIISKNKKTPKYNEWLYSLIEDGFPPQNILIVGLKNSHTVEIKYLEELGVKKIFVNDLFLDLEGYTDVITEFGYGKNIYLSINSEVIDPAFMPSVNRCNPGGLSSREFLYILNRVSKIKSLLGIDLVGLNFTRDFNHLGENLSIKIIEELM